MGTRSITRFYEDNGLVIANLYRQYDGYPTGHGDELARFVAARTLVNGLPIGSTQKLANGMGCLAAQVIAHCKMRQQTSEGASYASAPQPGGFYLYAADAYDVGEDFVYEVRSDSLRAYRVSGFGEAYKLEEIYNGPAAGFDGKAIEKALCGAES